MEEKKKPWESKTVVASAVLGVAGLVPGVSEVVASHPEESMGILGLIFLVLRFLTGAKIGIK